MKTLIAVILLFLATPALAQPLWSEDRGEITVNQLQLDKVFANTIQQFSLPLGGREMSLEVEKVSGPNREVSSLRARFKDQPHSFFLLCRTDRGTTVAFFQTDGGQAYRLDHTSGRDALRLVDSESMGSCAGELPPQNLHDKNPKFHPPTKPRNHNQKEAGVADDGSRHDIIMGYTPAAEEYVGGYDYIIAEVQLAVDAANLVYDNSLINSQLRLVHTMMTPYTETAAWNYTDHAIYLYTHSDGHMDDMLEMRNRVGADFVSVLIDGRDIMGDVPYCGAGPMMAENMDVPEFEYYAVSVVSVTCAAVNWSLAHEVGHNRGCAHNRESSQSQGLYPYSYGLRFYYDPETDFGLRTVMAYDHPDGGFTRVPHFSNPDVQYAGHPTGIAPGLLNEAHTALTQDNTAALCAAFRAERTFVDFENSGYADGSFLFPLPSVAQAIIGSRDGGHIVLESSQPGYTGVLSNPRSYLHDGPGSSVIGGN